MIGGLEIRYAREESGRGCSLLEDQPWRQKLNRPGSIYATQGRVGDRGDDGRIESGEEGGFNDTDFVGVFNLDTTAARPAGVDFDCVVVADGSAISDVELDDHEQSSFRFELGVTYSAGAEELGASDFQPWNVRGMVSDAHRVALAVAYPKAHIRSGGEGN